MLRRWLPWLALAVVLVVALLAGASRSHGPTTLEGHVRSVAAQIKCPTCEGLSAAEIGLRRSGIFTAAVIGLLVAIPAMFSYNFMVTTIRAITQELDGFASRYANQLEHLYVDNRPLSEEIKVTLKVSQNLHAGMGPYLLGALVAKDTKNPLDAGFHVEQEFLQSAKLDLSGSGQGDYRVG